MKDKELNVNNSKKLIIGLSIVFCTIILVIGTTIAYFTQGDNSELGNIVTTDIDGTLLYRDDYEENNLYNRQGLLIPASLDVVLNTYKRVDTENKCLDMNNYAACSVYRFSIKNNSNVSQELIMNLNPTANSYNNLKFLLFELKNDIPNQIKGITSLEKGKYDSIALVENFTLTPNEERIYELVFYVENQPYAQDDAGKTFGAGISINSITTGAYVNKQYGDTCWKAEEITEGEEKGTFKLTEFYGINNDETSDDYGKIDEACSTYVSLDETDKLYSIYIPANVGGKEISTLGNNLFNSEISSIANKNDWSYTYETNNYQKIKSVIIENGIKIIEDGEEIFSEDENSYNYQTKGTFYQIGYDSSSDSYLTEEVTISLPNSITRIGSFAFSRVLIKSLVLPSNLEIIGDSSFSQINISSLKIPSSVKKIGSGAFGGNRNLKELIFIEGNDSNSLKIEDHVFYDCDLTYENEQNSLILPARITSIGDYAFANEGGGNFKLNYIKYMGTTNLGNNWYNPANTNLLTPNIP